MTLTAGDARGERPARRHAAARRTNFAVSCEVADAVVLCLFDDAGDETDLTSLDSDRRRIAGQLPPSITPSSAAAGAPRTKH